MDTQMDTHESVSIIFFGVSICEDKNLYPLIKSVPIRTLVYPQTTTHGVYNFVSTNYSCPKWIQVLKNGYIHGYTFMCNHISSFVYPLFGHKSVSIQGSKCVSTPKNPGQILYPPENSVSIAQ